MDNTIVNQGFYKLNNKILKFNISKNKEEILFNHYIMQKENIQRIKNELPKGQFYLTTRNVNRDLNISYPKAQRLIKKFQDLGIIRLIRLGGKDKTPSIYSYCIAEIDSIIADTVVDTINDTVIKEIDTYNNINFSHSEHIDDTVKFKIDTVYDTVSDTSEKDNIKRNIKNNNISKDIYVSNDIDTNKESWNSLNISKVVSIKGNRLKLLNARIKEYGLGSVYAAIENVKQSDFLKGQNNRNWIINFDWFIRPNNFIKVLEGNYTNRIVKGQQEALQPLERVYEC